MIVTDREQRLFIGAALDAREKLRQFVTSSQLALPSFESEGFKT